MTRAEPLLTTGAVARELNVTDETIRRWIRDGRIAAIKLPSGQVRIRRSTLDEILTTLVEPATETSAGVS